MPWNEEEWLEVIMIFENASSFHDAIQTTTQRLGHRSRGSVEKKIRRETGKGQAEFFYSVNRGVKEKSLTPIIEVPKKEFVQQSKAIDLPPSTIRSALIIPDAHIPFMDLSAWNLMIQTSRYVRDTTGLHEIHVLGDFLDFWGFSFHPQNPNFAKPSDLLVRELDCGNDHLDELDEEFPDSEKRFNGGNHEDRLRRYIEKYAPMLDGMRAMSVAGQLRLDTRPKWTYAPFHHLQQTQVLDLDLYTRHCAPVGGTDFNVAKQAGSSVIYGHSHQEGAASWTTKIGDKKVYAINAGCLVDFDCEVFNYVRNRPNWTHSWVFISAHGDQWNFETVRVNKDKSCLFRGKRFEAE